MQWTNPRAGRTTALVAAYTALLGACLGMLLSACGGSSAPAAPPFPTATQFSVTTSATAQTSNCPQLLPPSQSCTVAVSFVGGPTPRDRVGTFSFAATLLRERHGVR